MYKHSVCTSQHDSEEGVLCNSGKHRQLNHTFTKIKDYEATLNFVVEVSHEELKRKRQEEKEAKRLRKLKRQERKAKIEADAKAKE